MQLKDRFRIKEIAINKDGTNIWYYPQYLITREKSTGMLWWKKEVELKRYSNFFKKNNRSLWNSGYTIAIDEAEERERMDSLVAFRTKEEAEKFIKEIFDNIKDYFEKSTEKDYKEIGALYEGEGIKTHQINI